MCFLHTEERGVVAVSVDNIQSHPTKHIISLSTAMRISHLIGEGRERKPLTSDFFLGIAMHSTYCQPCWCICICMRYLNKSPCPSITRHARTHIHTHTGTNASLLRTKVSLSSDLSPSKTESEGF